MSEKTLVEMVCDGALTVETASRRSTSHQLRALARRGAGALAKFPPGAGVLIDVADPFQGIVAALSAWWAGLRVAFARVDSPFGASQQAAAIDASAIVRSSGATAGEPATDGVLACDDLTGAPVLWPPRCRAGDVALDVLTSGTTGEPKCVVFTHASMVANGEAMATAMGVMADDRLWTPLPYCLPGVLGTVLLPAAAAEATAVLDAAADPLRLVQSLTAKSPSIVYAVPELYESMARSAPPEAALTDRVRWWLSSSSHLSRSVFHRMHVRWGAVVRSCYCASETGAVTFNGTNDVGAARDTVGSPLPGVSIEIRPADVTGDTSPPAQAGPAVGRIAVAGKLVASGYRDRAGAAPICRPTGGGAAVLTSDLGWIDKTGLLHLAGRADDRIKVGAETVDPGVVESHLGSLGGVEDCLVVARPHPRLGSVLEARIVRSGATSLSERAVIHHCRAQGLTDAWMPWAVTWVESIPRTPAGKPIRDRPA